MTPISVGGIVLCGGKSTRMGRPKAWLPFDGETLLHRVVRILATVVEPIVVVAAADQELPELPADTLISRDDLPERGPLQGIAAGLHALASHADAAYVSSCDVPLLAPAFVRHMIAALAGADVAVPFAGDRHQPLAAVYRTRIVEHVDRLLAAGRLRPVFLFDEVATNVVPADSLRQVDPHLDSLHNINTPADYTAALQKLTSL